MAHTHENCLRPSGNGVVCTNGQLTGFCNDGWDTYECYNEYCIDYGHCTCNCHSGKVCECGHVWPKMEKQNG